MQQTIQCGDINEFVTVVAALVREGLTFSANAANLLIELTGGY